MRQHHVLQFIGVLGLLVCAGWPQLASAQATAITSTPAPDSPFGNCNTTDPKVFSTLDGEGKKLLLKSGLPCAEIVSGGDVAEKRLASFQRGFDFNSWLTFIALNAPGKTLDMTQAQPHTRTVWEDGEKFIPLLDVMLSGGAKPEWDPKKRFVPPACRAQFDADTNLMVVKMIEESYNQPFKTGPLIDQNNNYAIFDILMNKAMFDYMVSNKLYSRALQASDQNSNLRIDFPSGRAAADKRGPVGHGSIMIKVSWKILAGDDDKSKFHHVEALVATPATEDQQKDPPCLRKTLGLVGFHVVHKTTNRPQWIWASFEHKDNVPEAREIKALREQSSKRKFNFFTLSCSDSDCPINETPPRPWDPEHANELQFRRISEGPNKGKMLFNSQIARTVHLTDETNLINNEFHGVLPDKSVWANYILIGTQWPSDFPCATHPSALKDPPLPGTDFDKEPDMNCAPAPTFLANSTLETYSQGEIPQASSSCMGCHGNATSYIRRTTAVRDQNNPTVADETEKRRQMFMNQSDFTFMLEKAR